MELVYNFNRSIANGVTKPVLISTENGDTFVLKYIHENCNSKVLFNELISYRLAELLKVPVPNHCLLKLEQNFIDRTDYMLELQAKPCVCFATQYIKGTSSISPVFLENSINTCDIPKIILFDQLIMNEDRSVNPGNVLYAFKEKKILAIDHSHVFRNGMIWEANMVNTMASNSPIVIKNLDGDLYKYFSKYINGHSPFAKICSDIQKMQKNDLNEIFEDIPPDWKITKTEVDSVKKLILAQMSNLDGIMKLMKSHFNNWKGA